MVRGEKMETDIKRISKAEFDASFTKPKFPHFSPGGIVRERVKEKDWYASENYTFVGTVFMESVDKDWNFAIIDTRLKRGEQCIDVAVSFPNQKEATQELIKRMSVLCNKKEKYGKMRKMKRYPININAIESGVLIATIWESKNGEALKAVFDQLLDLRDKFREEDGVQIEDHGESITMVDKDGTTISRSKYEWEK